MFSVSNARGKLQGSFWSLLYPRDLTWYPAPSGCSINLPLGHGCTREGIRTSPAGRRGPGWIRLGSRFAGMYTHEHVHTRPQLLLEPLSIRDGAGPGLMPGSVLVGRKGRLPAVPVQKSLMLQAEGGPWHVSGVVPRTGEERSDGRWRSQQEPDRAGPGDQGEELRTVGTLKECEQGSDSWMI